LGSAAPVLAAEASRVDDLAFAAGQAAARNRWVYRFETARLTLISGQASRRVGTGWHGMQVDRAGVQGRQLGTSGDTF
jgi:hypothetical protein